MWVYVREREREREKGIHQEAHGLRQAAHFVEILLYYSFFTARDAFTEEKEKKQGHAWRRNPTSWQKTFDSTILSQRNWNLIIFFLLSSVKTKENLDKLSSLLINFPSQIVRNQFAFKKSYYSCSTLLSITEKFTNLYNKLFIEKKALLQLHKRLDHLRVFQFKYYLIC